MKLLKTIAVLSLAILSLSSTVAFGCVAEQVTGTGVASTKNLTPNQPVNAPVNTGTQSQANQPQ